MDVSILRKSKKVAALLFNSTVLSLHSRSGINVLLSVARCCAVLAIGLNVTLTVHFDDRLTLLAYILYASASLAMLALSVIRSGLLEKPVYFVFLVALDTFFILLFFFLRRYPQSELYLLLLIPLITAAHFLERKLAVAMIALALLSYFGILAFMVFSQEDFQFIKQFWIWWTRSSFLLSATFFYRAQRTLPSGDQGRVIGPKAARRQLEDLLAGLQESVSYNTTSLQLLYGERLVIAACSGFENPQSIYHIEFPTSDKRFPNHKVVASHQWKIEDPDNYPVFQEHIYHAERIKSWLGVPLISPTTGELIGMLSIDSWKKSAFTRFDAWKAACFAKEAAAFLIESPLGPAALTQATRRNDIETSLKRWKKDLRRITTEVREEARIADEIVKLAKQLFKVEDCSFYLVRSQHEGPHRRRRRILHLVASSTIPASEFSNHESPVSTGPGTGLTGYAVCKNVTLNMGAQEIEASRYHSGKYKGHLEHLDSGRSRQVLIIPIRDSRGSPIGAFKLENKMGTASDLRFVGLEQNLAEVFVHETGLILEGVRKRNLEDDQRDALHNLRAIFSDQIIRSLNDLLDKNAELPDSARKDLEAIRRASRFSATVIDNMMYDGLKKVDLGVESVLTALEEYLILASPSIPHLREARSRVKFQPSLVRDELLPYEVRMAFFRTGREALYNAIRHSHIENKPDGFIELDFCRSDLNGQTVHTLTVRDTGDGFPVKLLRSRESSFGLRAMEKQEGVMRDLGHDFKIDIKSARGMGTTVTVTWKGKVDGG